MSTPKPSLRHQIQAILEAHPEGLSLTEITTLLGGDTPYTGVRQSLLNIPLAYVDRWYKGAVGPYKSIWCLSNKVEVDCPRPSRKP